MYDTLSRETLCITSPYALFSGHSSYHRNVGEMQVDCGNSGIKTLQEKGPKVFGGGQGLNLG
jgi:hypothetical protein